METSLDLSRWREAPRGVNYRRGTIIIAGLKQLMRTRLFKALLAVAWMGGLAVAAGGFAFSQSVATGGWLETLATHISPRAEAIVKALGAFVTLYPDIVVRGVFTELFWLHSFLAVGLTLIALTAMVPHLITRDRASNALTVYLSRPLTSVDYLLGKLGTIVGAILLLWTGPLLFGWLLSMLFATDRDFVVYSFTPLLRALAFNGLALAALAAIALGVSALSALSRVTTTIWIGLWIVLGVFASNPNAPNWLRRASFTHDLTEIRSEVFRVDEDLKAAASQLPLLDQRFVQNLTAASQRAQPVDFNGALASLAGFVALSSFVFLRKLRSE
jgi:ABC-2 type transport system permease protein